MSSNSRLAAFLRDERGSYTIWSLIWFMMYVAIGGLAVDITDAYRTQTLLQSTADAAALAGVMSLPNEAAVNAAAEGYAASNMPPSVHGTVLKDTEVFIGRWDFDTRTFTPGASNPNAVRAITRRSTANANPVLTNFLRIIGLGFWNVHTDAIAASGHSDCDEDGFNAGNELFIRARNEFWGVCLHGEYGFAFKAGGSDASDNDFDEYTRISTWCTDCVKAPVPALGQEDFQHAYDPENGGGPNVSLPPKNAYNVGEFIDTLKMMAEQEWDADDFQSFVDPDVPDNVDNLKYDAWERLFKDANGNWATPNYETEWNYPPDDTSVTTFYNISCQPKFQLPITGDEPVERIVLIADCPITATADVNMRNSIIASSWTGNNPKQDGVSMAAKAGLGDATCGTGVEIYSNASVHLSAQGELYGTRIVAAHDVKLTSGTSSGGTGDPATHYGISVEAGGDIDMSSGNSFGVCPDGGPPPGPRELRYVLVD